MIKSWFEMDVHNLLGILFPNKMTIGNYRSDKNRSEDSQTNC